MTSGVYTKTEEHKRKLRKSRSQETKQKMSKSALGRHSPSKEATEKRRASLKKYYREHPGVQDGKNNPNYIDGRTKNKNKRSLKNYYLQRSYGITLSFYNQMFENQHGCCAICDKHQSELSQALGVDHNHRTQEIRGLLCKNCNAALGQFDGDVGTRLLRKAIGYIRGNN